MVSEKSEKQCEKQKNLFFPAAIIMAIAILCIVFFPLFTIGGELNVKFSDIIDILDNFDGDVMAGVMITMTIVSLLGAVVSLFGALFKVRSLCMISAAVSGIIMTYFLYCFLAEFGTGVLFGENAIISWGIWLAFIGQIATFIYCLKLSKDT